LRSNAAGRPRRAKWSTGDGGWTALHVTQNSEAGSTGPRHDQHAASAAAGAAAGSGPEGRGVWLVRGFWNPLALLIFIGPAIMALGGLVSLTDRRLRLAAGRQREVRP
jgi:hypothetical protein